MPGNPPSPSSGRDITSNDTPKPGLYLNWKDWLPYMEDFEISLEEKRKLIEALWVILFCFEDMDYQLHGPDDVTDKETCGQVIDLKAALEAAMVSSEGSSTHPKTKKEEV